MTQKKFTAFIPKLLFGFGMILTYDCRPIYPATIAIDTFDVVATQSNIYVPIVYYSGRSDNPEPGFYHQAILLQKSTDNYFDSKSINFQSPEGGVFIFKDDFKY